MEHVNDQSRALAVKAKTVEGTRMCSFVLQDCNCKNYLSCSSGEPVSRVPFKLLLELVISRELSVGSNFDEFQWNSHNQASLRTAIEY